MLLGYLFSEKPDHWSLRGVPPLWDALLDYFKAEALPRDEAGLVFKFEHAFQQISGYEWTDDNDHLYA